MKRIDKQPSPDAFEQWKQTPIDTHGRLPDWSNLHGKRKREVMRALLDEQGWICCYCNAAIGARQGDCHIEHFRPRSHYPDLKLDYQNLFASCQGELPPEPNHCGHRKRDWFDEDLTLDPCAPSTRDALRYLEDGRVRPTSHHPLARAAQETISRLSLNANSLLRQREAALDVALGLDLADPLTPAELQALLSALSERDPQGCFSPFCDALTQCIARLLSPSEPQAAAPT